MKSKLILLILIIWVAVPAYGQEPPPLSAEQQNLLAQLDAADADMRTWQSHKTVSFGNLLYSEILTVSFGNALTTQRSANSTVTVVYDGNPLSLAHQSDALMTIEYEEQRFLPAGEQVTESYVLTVNARYYDARLKVMALRHGGSPNLSPMPEALVWVDVTDNPDQFPALEVANLERYLPEPPESLAPHPLLDADFVRLVQQAPLRDLIADIELVADGVVLTDGLNAGLTVREIRVQLNPVAVLDLAFAGLPDATTLVNAFANEGVDMSMTVWLDAATSRRVREQFVFLVQGQPLPTAFGYAPGEVAEDGGLGVIFQLESDISYLDVNVPVSITAPE